MRDRPTKQFRPGLEPLEARRPLSAGLTTAHPVGPWAGPETPTAVGAPGGRPQGPARITASRTDVKPNYGYLVYRITNPSPYNDKLVPPFRNVLVQTRQPRPGQVYNILYVAVRNGTLQTFDARSGFRVMYPSQYQSFPILTGSEQWKPGQEFVFYVLTKKYYPLHSPVHSGYEFDLGGARSIAIPGPSGIFLRVTYNPATFDRVLDHIVAYGPGAQGGKGVKFGLPDTAINEFVNAKTQRKDFGGYF